jgi:hypothetical protein
VDFDQVRPQRRRSERVAKALPIVVRGTDLLGQPFEERTATLNFNLHGCRYASRYHLPKNAWVTLEVPHGSEFENTRARVAWIQRPHSVREFFQISVELEAPQNIWGFEPSPEDWATVDEASLEIDMAEQFQPELERENPSEQQLSGPAEDSREPNMDETNAVFATPEPAFEGSALAERITGNASVQSGANPDAVPVENAGESNAQPAETSSAQEGHPSWMSKDVFDNWKNEFAQLQETARERLAGYQTELLGEMKSEFDQNLEQAKWLVAEIEKSREALHAENEAAAGAVSRLAHERSAAAETAESHERTESHDAGQFVSEEAAAAWRARIASEMDAAQGQWNELLQSSLDRGVHRLAEKLTERAGEVIRPLVETVNAAEGTASEIRQALNEELTRAKASLEEIERSAAQFSSLSGQIDSATSSALDDLNRRLELILNAQTQEMGERAEKLTSGASARAASEISAASRTAIDTVVKQVESKLTPHYDRVSELLRELSSRELQAEESLRLQRERLRQVSDASHREFLSQFDSLKDAVRSDFEAARETAAAKWNEEVAANAELASSVSSAAAEKASQAVEERSRGRLQNAADEVLAASSQAFETTAAEAKQEFAGELESVSVARFGLFQTQLDGLAAGLTSRSCTDIERAAEAAAAAFGEVLRGVSGREIESFRSSAATIVETHTDTLEVSARKLLRNFETNAESSLGRFHQQMAAQLETSIAEGRSALSSEFSASLTAFRAERDTHERDWTENLERMNADSVARYQERINTACDSWVVSSVRRLNEHGQNLVESMMRSADEAVRESCAKLFDGLAEILRERSTVSGPAESTNRRAAAEAAVPPRTDSY